MNTSSISIWFIEERNICIITVDFSFFFFKHLLGAVLALGGLSMCFQVLLIGVEELSRFSWKVVLNFPFRLCPLFVSKAVGGKLGLFTSCFYAKCKSDVTA